MRSDTRDFLKGMAFISPWLIGFAVFTVVPVALSLYYSFCQYPFLQHPVWVGTENYRGLMHDAQFGQVLFNTAYYSVLALPLGLMIALGVAILLNTKIKGQSIYRTIIFLPSLVPAVASAMLWLWLFNGKLGLINFVLRGIGFNDPPVWLGDVRFALPALVLMSFWGVGNTVVIFLAGLQDVPRELFEAAELDGANKLQGLWHVTIPTISPVIFFNLVLGIIGSLQVFALPFIMTGGGPDRSTRFYTMYLYDNVFQFLKVGYASAMAWIQLLIILALTAAAFLTSRKWVHYQ